MLAIDIVVLIIVVALIFHRLWKVLGTRPETEAKRVKLSREGAEKLYNLLKSEAEKELKIDASKIEELVPLDSKPLSEIDAILVTIPNFKKDSFINGAKKAFQVITEAFNKADIETLKMLVSKSIFNKMQEVIKQRKEDNITAETDFICFEKVDIIKASINDKQKALISVEFVSEQVNLLRNKDNEIIEGDENYIQTITDVWTFERSLDAKTLNWVLVSTKK
ncbi:MAG: Tim44 domain-containing protein [Alphaproteobacteria bacterium]|nr:Tim44 domain-containing protein [Alphaproteobacteria bacterium]